MFLVVQASSTVGYGLNRSYGDNLCDNNLMGSISPTLVDNTLLALNKTSMINLLLYEHNTLNKAANLPTQKQLQSK